MSAKSRQSSDFLEYLSSRGYNAIHKPIEVRWNYQMNLLRDILAIEAEDLKTGLTNASA